MPKIILKFLSKILMKSTILWFENVLLVKKKMFYYTERPSLTLTVSTFCKNKRITCQVPYSPTLWYCYKYILYAPWLPFSIITFSITLSSMKLRIINSVATLSISNNEHNDIQHNHCLSLCWNVLFSYCYAECYYHFCLGAPKCNNM